MKKLKFLLICLCFLLVGCGSSSNEEPTTVPPISTTLQDESQSDTSLKESISVVIAETLEKNFDDVNVSWDGTTIVINYIYPGLNSVVKEILSTNNSSLIKKWDHAISSQKELCNTVLSLAKDNGIDDVSVLVNVCNEVNPENALLIIFNDTVIYDAVHSN